jgi:hypothetical protein
MAMLAVRALGIPPPANIAGITAVTHTNFWPPGYLAGHQLLTHL